MIICTWNSQITSTLSQIWVSCSTLLMTSFPLEKNIQWLNRDQRHPPWLPGFSFAQISPLLWSFFSILVEFHWDRGIERREILNQYTSGIATISNYKYCLHSTTILTQPVAWSYTCIFFPETKYCYSRYDFKGQLVPFSLFLGHEHGKGQF